MSKLPNTGYRSHIVFTLVSTFAALSLVVAPPTVHPGSVSVLDALMMDVQAIVGLTRASKYQELVTFGEHLSRVARLLVSALQNDQLMQQPDVMKNLEEIRQALSDISRQISRINVPLLPMSRIRHKLIPAEDQIGRVRQQLSDVLELFRFFTLTQLLARNANSPNGQTDRVLALAFNQPQTIDQSNPPAHGCSCTLGGQTTQIPEDTQASSVLPIDSDALRVQRRVQESRCRHAATAMTRDTAPRDGEVTAAFMKVDRLRRSLRHNRSFDKEEELASALNHLSNLLVKVGRTHEALKISQESAGLYRILAEREHTDLYTL